MTKKPTIIILTPELKREIGISRNLFRTYEREEAKARTLSLQLGESLIRLKVQYEAALGSKRAGFTRWAAGKLKKAEKTIENLMRLARNPEQYEREKSQSRTNARGWLTRARNAYDHLDDAERLQFLEWLDGKLSQGERFRITYDHKEGRTQVHAGSA